VPETIRILITGRTPRGVFVRDIVHHIIARLAAAGAATDRIIEFYGGGVDRMSVSERMTLCHIACGVGAAAAVCPFDTTTRRYVNPRARRSFTPAMADRNAVYAAEYTFEVNKMKPAASGPGTVTEFIPVEQLDGVPIQQVYLGGMANGRFDDLKIAADILKGKRVNPDVRMFVHPVSRAVYLEALKKGLVRVFVEAGAVVCNPGGPDAILQMAPPAKEEKALTTLFAASFDYGSGEMYQVSPATAAASALTGQITNPAGYVKT
jgi:3-isopropylmalate/(R)-2-methylmalate dehydratase large subunit